MEGDPATLERQLRTLKRHGSNLLVLTDPAVGRVCRRLLGSDTELRRRLIVKTHGTEAVSDDRTASRFGFVEVPGNGTRTTLADAVEGQSLREETSVVDPSESLPETGTVDTDATAGPDWFSRTPTDPPLVTVARHLHDHLTRFEAHDPDPGEVRVCFDSLTPFVDDVEQTRLARFLRVVTARTKSVNAIGHFHLSTNASAETRAALEPLFDATIETRVGSTGPQQRWTLHRTDVQTDWLQLE